MKNKLRMTQLIINNNFRLANVRQYYLKIISSLFLIMSFLIINSVSFPISATTNAIWQGSSDRKVVALTFDDGPKPEFSLQILETLQKEGVRATFFVVGEEAEENLDVLFQMADFGHEIGSHSYNSQTLTGLSRAKIRGYLLETNRIIESVTGKKVKYMRPPGGAMNEAVVEEAEKLGLKVICWTINASDYIEDHPEFRVPENYEILAEDLVKKVMNEVQPGSIILFHNGSGQAIVALPEIIKKLRVKGYGFVTISELLLREGG